MREKHHIACGILHGLSWKKWTTGTAMERLKLLLAGQEHILEQDDGKKRFVQVVTELSQAFALCAASDEATAIRDDLILNKYGFPPDLQEQAVKTVLQQAELLCAEWA